MTQKFRFDNSAACATARCTTEAALRYVNGYTSVEDSAALRAGSAVHAALDYYLSNDGDTKGAVAVLFSEYSEWANENVADEDRLAYRSVRSHFQQWMTNHPIAKLPFVLKDATFETMFAIDMGDFEFAGRLDGIVRDRITGNWYILEHKTTGNLTSYWAQKWQTASQVTGYVWAGAQLKEQPMVGAFINAIELAKLPSDPTRKCKLHNVVYRECADQHGKSQIIPTTRTPNQVGQWLLDIRRLAKRFQRMRELYPTLDLAVRAPQEGTFHGACQFCTFKQFCQTGRKLELAPTMLRHEPWEVLAVEP